MYYLDVYELGNDWRSLFVAGAFPYEFDAGTGLIHLDNVNCDGTESSITECEHLGIGIHDCDHSEDAGVVCLSGTHTC